MASARITQRWPDGIEVEVEVYAEGSYPDALDQVRNEATRLWRDVFTDEDAEP